MLFVCMHNLILILSLLRYHCCFVLLLSISASFNHRLVPQALLYSIIMDDSSMLISKVLLFLIIWMIFNDLRMRMRGVSASIGFYSCNLISITIIIKIRHISHLDARNRWLNYPERKRVCISLIAGGSRWY